MTASQQYCLRWNNHRSNLLTVFEELLQNSAFTDVTLAIDSGTTIRCHKIVLAACSTYFQNLFHELPSQQHPIIILKDVKYSEMKAIMEYMYRGEVNVAQNELSDLLKIAQMLKVKGLVEEHGHSGTARDLRREDAIDTSISPPPAISTSTGGSGGSRCSPLHSTATTPPPHYPSLYGKSGISLDRVQSHLASSFTWPLSLHSGAGHQLSTSSLSSTVLGGGSYDNGIETSPLKRRKLLQPSTLLMNNDTPILRTVLGQAHVDSSQTMPPLQPDSHESVHYRNASSNRSANDSDNRRSNEAHSEAAHADVSYMDEDERQPSPQSYGGDTVRNSGSESIVTSDRFSCGFLKYSYFIYCQYLATRSIAFPYKSPIFSYDSTNFRPNNEHVLPIHCSRYKLRPAEARVETLQAVHPRRHRPGDRGGEGGHECRSGGAEIRRAVAHALRQGEKARHPDIPAVQALGEQRG